MATQLRAPPSSKLRKGVMSVRSFRGVILLSFTAVIIVFAVFSAQLQVPTVFAEPSFTSSSSGMPATNTCTGCHSGSAAAGGGVVVTFPLGTTYTPGSVQHLKVTLTDPTHTRWSYLLTARLANSLSSQAGSFTNPDANSRVAGQDIEAMRYGSSSWTFDWIPPAAGAGNVNFYVIGLAAGSPGGSTNGNGIYQSTFMLTPAAVTPPSPAPTPPPTLSASPTTLSFNYPSGTTTSGSQSIMVSGTAKSYTAAASGGAWLSATPTTGNTPGTVTVSVNPAGLVPNTYNGTVTIASTGATGSPQTVNVKLTVTAALTTPPTTPPTLPPTTTSSLSASPTTLSFNYPSGTTTSGSQSIMVSGTAKSYTASASGGAWLSATPTTGNTPGTVTVSVKTTGLAPNTYNGTVTITSTGATGSPQTVGVKLVVTAPTVITPTTVKPGAPSQPQNPNMDSDDDEGGGRQGLYAQPSSYDTLSSGALYAHWIDRLGVPQGNSGQKNYPGLVLSKNATAPTGSQVGALIRNADGLSLTELGFDYREGGQCTATSPYFEVVTTDGRTHVVGGCSKGTIQQPPPAAGWTRVRFNLSDPNQQSSPPINPSDHVKSIELVLDQGPETGASAAGGLVVIDNIDINGMLVGKK
jgi:hypothetical protein